MSKLVMFLMFVMAFFFSAVGLTWLKTHGETTAFLWIGVYFSLAFVYYLVKNRKDKTENLNAVGKS